MPVVRSAPGARAAKPRAKSKSKPSEEKAEVTWSATHRCTLGDLCAQDKKKVSNLISKVVELNRENAAMEKELTAFRRESERLREENMELHKLSGSLQTRLMQALVLAKSAQDQLKLKKPVFTVETQTTAPPRAPRPATGVVHDFSCRGERGPTPCAPSGGVEEEAAEAPGRQEQLKRTTYGDRTLYYEGETGTGRVHRFQMPGVVDSEDLEPVRGRAVEREGAAFGTPPRPRGAGEVPRVARAAGLSDEIEDIIGVINSEPPLSGRRRSAVR